MLQITRSGRIADAIASVRDVPARVIPYAAAVALTKSAKLAQADVVASLPRVFDRPTRYTLNATRVETATAKDLTARVAVKDQASGGATAAESFLKAEVFGGRRNEKRFEKSLRLKGILPRGMSAMPGSGAKLDASGNLPRAFSRSIEQALEQQGKGKGNKRTSKRSALISSARGQSLFVGKPKNHNFPAGVWARDGRHLHALLVFTPGTPGYRKLLDFSGLAEKVVRANFERLFADAATSIVGRRG